MGSKNKRLSLLIIKYNTQKVRITGITINNPVKKFALILRHIINLLSNFVGTAHCAVPTGKFRDVHALSEK
jgi:hypothetical protein